MFEPALTAIAAFIIGALVAAIAVYLRLKGNAHLIEQTLRKDKDALAGRLASAEAQAQRVPMLEEQLGAIRAEHDNRGATIARLEQQVRSAQQREVETTKLLEDTKAAMTKEFERLAGRFFDEKGSKLNEQQRDTLNALLNPFNDSLKDFKAKVEQSREADVEARGKLFAQISNLTQLNHDLGDKAQSLTDALRGESKTRGIWGEQVLQKLLELAGLREGVNFRTQASHHEEESGKRLIPDVVLDLPQDRAIVIDAKVSLVAYERYGAAADDETARAQALRDHCASIKQHIRALSEKNYPRLYGLNSVDFTILFVPIESALMVASEAEPDLAQYALERHIALVSPDTLFVVLHTIDYVWRVEKTTRNMDKIVKRGELMYDAARRFGEYIVAINDALAKASDAARDAEKALNDPSRGLVRQAERLREFGVKPKKAMPERLADAGEDDADDNPASLPSTAPPL